MRNHLPGLAVFLSSLFAGVRIVPIRSECCPSIKLILICNSLACSQTLYFLFKVCRVRVIKFKPQGIYWPPAQRGRLEEQNRRSVDISGCNWNLLFPGKANYHWLIERQLPCHHQVNKSSHSHHATRSVCYRLDVLTATLTTYCICIKKITLWLGMQSYHKLVLSISFVFEYRLWQLVVTVFIAITYSKFISIAVHKEIVLFIHKGTWFVLCKLFLS